MFPIVGSLGLAKKQMWERVLRGLPDDEQMNIPAQVSSEIEVNAVMKSISKTGLPPPLLGESSVYLCLATLCHSVTL